MHLYHLDEARAEAIFAPFHDPLLSPALGAQLRAVDATRCRLQPFWDATHIHWDACGVEKEACRLVLPCQLPADDYDQFLFCITFSEQVQLAFDALVDGHWTELKAYTPGCSSRQEITCPIPRGTVPALQMRCYAMNDQAAVVRVH
ncbi:MAG TPA: hypothetical protein PKC18_00875, partial [Lacipirellulaceae bacterium]|nr:hypothetical protein [Lacipirellulaceae bacterium]